MLRVTLDPSRSRASEVVETRLCAWIEAMSESKSEAWVKLSEIEERMQTVRNDAMTRCEVS